MLLNSLLMGLRSQAVIQAEIIALRHQLTVLQRNQPKRLVLNCADRCLWVWLSRLWSGWRYSLIIVKPETIIGWHRQGFRWYWTWKIRHGRSGRPRVPKETRDLIRTMSRENPTRGAPRIHSELMKLDIKISEASIAKYMIRSPKPPSQTWRTFLNNHVHNSVQLTFSLCTRFGLKSCSSLSFSPMTDGVLSTLMSRLIRQLNGRRSKCSKPFLSTPHRDICCEIVMASTVGSSTTKSQQ